MWCSNGPIVALVTRLPLKAARWPRPTTQVGDRRRVLCRRQATQTFSRLWVVELKTAVTNI